MKKLILIALFAIVAGPVLAQDNEAEKKEVIADAQSAETDAVQLASQLSRYGYANKSAISLIDAARIVKENGLKKESYEVDSKDNQPTQGGDEGKKGKISLDADQLLKDAAALAGNDKHLLAMIDQVKTVQKRGAVNGPGYDYYRLYGNRYVQYSVSFYANSVARVTVTGDGDTDLDLYIYDSNGNLIVKDDDYTDQCICTWVPRWTGRFYIKVINRGSVYNDFYLHHN